jgi:hypothetical protein
MNITYSNKRAFYGDLEEVFSKMLSLSEVRNMYNAFFHELKKEPLKKINKIYMVEAFMKLAQSAEDMHLFVKTFPKTTYQAYGLLIWNEFLPVEQIQKELGSEIVRVEPGRDNWSSNTFAVREEFPFIGLFARNRYYSGKRLENYQVSIPPAIRKWLKPHFPKPKYYNIEPLQDTDISNKDYMVFDASSTIATDLGQLADFLKRSNPSRTQKGDFTKTSLRRAASLLESGDWYPDKSKNPELELMRCKMILDFIEGFESKLLSQLLAAEIQEPVLRDIFKALQEDDIMLEKWLLGHLRHTYYYYQEELKKRSIYNLFALFKSLPLNVWVSLQNLRSMQFYQEIDICFFKPEKYEFRGTLESGSVNYRNTHTLTNSNLQILGIDPLINGVAFLLSAFGFVQLAYKTPYNQTARTNKSDYLTYFDGAHAVRLTDAGAYVFGHYPAFKLKNKSRQVATLRLHPEQLHVTCRNLDPVTELALKEFMEPIAPEFYKMTRASLLKGCQSASDLKTRIADFRNRIEGLGVKFPENWEHFLTSLAKEKLVLLPENKLKIFTLANCPELQNHFTKDPYLRKYSLRVEGQYVAIKKRDLPLVRSHLRNLGYLVES